MNKLAAVVVWLLALAPSEAAAQGPDASCPAGLRCTPLRDPVLGMDAFLVAAPPGWHTQGAVVQGTPCKQLPFPVFRISSPDGLTLVERLPRMDWRWGKFQGQSPKEGCLPLRDEIGPADFLRTLSGVMGVEYVAEVPTTPAQMQSQKSFNAEADARSERNSRNHPNTYEAHHLEIAQAKVRYQNGSFPMEGLLMVTLYCHRFAYVGGRNGNWSEDCQATVRAVRARAGKLDETVRAVEMAGATMIPRWNQAYQAMMAARDAQAAQQYAVLGQQQLQLQAQLAQQSLALQKLQHDQYMAAQDAQFAVGERRNAAHDQALASSAARHYQNMAARDAVASDWVDTALGQQTVRDPTSGQVSKVSGMYDYTWVDQTGKSSYQTRDPNANPNGVIQGTWTVQQRVHGDGSSR